MQTYVYKFSFIMKKFRIGIDASNLLQGGGRTHLIEFIDALDNLDHQLEKIIIWGNKETLNIIKNRKWILKKNNSMLNAGIFKRTLWQIFYLKNDSERESCDILFIPGGNYFSSYCPVVTMCRNMLPFELRELRRYGWSLNTLRLIILRWTQSFSFRSSDGIIFLTNYAKKKVKSVAGYLKGEIKVIPHGVNSRFNSMPRNQHEISSYSNRKPFKIIYVSIINQYKHQWKVIEALGKLKKKKNWNIQLDLVGPANKNSLKKLYSAIEIWDPNKSWVNYNGQISYLDLNKAYLNADMGIFASTCENMPNVLLEMMSMGLPIASSNYGPMKEILRNAGIYFDPENCKQIINAVNKFIVNPKLRKKKANLAYKLARKYNWEKCASSTLDFFLKIIDKKNSKIMC